MDPEVAFITVLVAVGLGVLGAAVWLIVSGLVGIPGAPTAQCRACRYDLRGTPYTRVCPECGAALLLPEAICHRTRLRQPERVRIGLTLIVPLALGIPFLSLKLQTPARPVAPLVAPGTNNAPMMPIAYRRVRPRSPLSVEASQDAPSEPLVEDDESRGTPDSEISQLLPWSVRTLEEQSESLVGQTPPTDSRSRLVERLSTLLGPLDR